jgi:hydroxymethylpyrimidine/phosphomethylpyrimidine kinase
LLVLIPGCNNEESRLPNRVTPSPIKTAIALTIAGSDSSGGAGIQADLKTFSALGAYGASVITAITAQNTRSVTAVHDIPADMVLAQIRAVLDDLKVDAIKIGMLSSPDIIQAVCKGLTGFERAIVLDPVMVAKSGDILLQHSAIECLKSDLLPMASLITPNLPEAAQLLECDMATDESSMLAQGQALLEMGASAVLMKGGHGTGSECIDILITRTAPAERYRASRIDTRNTHGTGCTLSASIAAHLAQNLPLNEAVKCAHAYLQQAIKAADSLSIGQGHGPVHHFHHQW